MLRNAKTLERYELQASDGVIGHVKDFYFDDRHWTVRYLVVDAGTWLSSRKVLISPLAVRSADWTRRVLPVDLSKEQVRNSPGIETEGLVSRHEEVALNDYYGWPYYWGALAFTGAVVGAPVVMAAPPSEPAISAPAQAYGDAPVEETDSRESHVRSVRDVTDSAIEASDGAIGHVDDFLIDDESWEIKYLVVDTKNWWPGKKVVISPSWISPSGWTNDAVRIDLTREAIKAAPEYDPTQPMQAQYADRLHDHYDRPRYGPL